MGIIFRQTLKSSIYSYIGVLFGFITAGWLMPQFLSPEEIGVIRLIQYYALFISSIIGIGVPQSIAKMFPYFKDERNKHYGFVTLISFISFSGILVFTILFWQFSNAFFLQDFENSPLFQQYYSLILPFTIATALFTLYDSYSNVRQESTIGVFLKDFILRVFILGAIGIYIYVPIFGYTELIYSITYIQFIPVILIILFLVQRRLIPIATYISFPTSTLRKEFFSVSSFNWINGLSSVAVVTIDSIMISKLISTSEVGIYTTVTFYAGIMLIPNKSLGKIATAIIAQHFKNENLNEIKLIYKKSAVNLFILGLFLFGNLVFVLPLIFSVILHPDYETGYWVLIFLALSNLFKMSTGVKLSVIFTSKYYRWSTLLFIGYLILIILTNFIFIPSLGIIGAAIASLIATTLFHLSGIIFVRIKLGFWPFDFSFIQIGGLFMVIGTVLIIIPNFNSPVILGIIKSGIFSILFLALIYKLKVSQEINEYINKWLI